jgi:lon-related putative ATP-dependent protease
VRTALRPDDLYVRCDPDDIPFETTDEVHEYPDLVGQERALDALQFAVTIRHDGYNVFALGREGIGKQTTLQRFFEAFAARQAPPPDWCYVHDHAAPQQPRAIELPAGTSSTLRSIMENTLEELRGELPRVFESEAYRRRKRALADELEQRQQRALDDVQQRARNRRVTIVRSDNGVVIAPLRNDHVVGPEEFQLLPDAEQRSLRSAIEEVGGELATKLNELTSWTHQHQDAVAALDRDMALVVTRGVFDRVRICYQHCRPVLDYLNAAERDIVEHVDALRGANTGLNEMLHGLQTEEDRMRRYHVNVMVDHAGSRGAPVIYEDNPTYTNLFGRIDYSSQLGALVTDFRLIKPGALHRANGGYLVIDALKLLRQPFAWDALKRALRTKEIRIEPVGQQLGLLSTVTLEPEPIPLRDTKLVLFGERDVYRLLAELDPDFVELFKVMADFEQTIDRTAETGAMYARLVAGVVNRSALRPFGRGAVARVLEETSRLAGDAHKLSVRLRPVIDLLLEADHRAGLAGHEVAAPEDVQAAVDARRLRAGQIHDRVLEAIRRRMLIVDTEGACMGQVNALSVMELGEHTFGHPTRITARARVGKGEVLDIEREVALGGPIHSKGILILSGFLGSHYAQRMPLSLAATIVFEQSYGGVDGDSASLAELCALLSAIAEVPIRQSLAVTGSVNQHGRVQPVGGVNEKVEGFFDVCAQRGMTGEQGVLIPRANVQHLMLRRDVVEAVEQGRFQIHAVDNVEEAIQLLTGHEAGTRDETGAFPEDSFNARVEARLQAFSDDVRRHIARAQ